MPDLEERLLKHPFVQSVLQRIQPRASSLIKEIDFAKPPSPREQERRFRALSEAARYDSYVFDSISALARIAKRADYALYLLPRSPAGQSSQRFQLRRSDWMDYHFTQFTAAFASAVDCSIILAVRVHRLGLDYRHCKLDIVTSCSGIPGGSTANSLQSLSRKLSQHIHRRHRYLHRGEDADVSELTEPGFLRDLKTVDFLASVKPSFVSGRQLNQFWREAFGFLVPALGAATKDLAAGVERVLDALAGPYKRTSEQLDVLANLMARRQDA